MSFVNLLPSLSQGFAYGGVLGGCAGWLKHNDVKETAKLALRGAVSAVALVAIASLVSATATSISFGAAVGLCVAIPLSFATAFDSFSTSNTKKAISVLAVITGSLVLGHLADVPIRGFLDALANLNIIYVIR